MKNFKKIIFVFVLISLLAGGFCLAQGKGRELEIKYPELGVTGVETPTITESSALGDYLKYVFTLAVIIGGLIVFGALIYGGIRYLTSAGDPTKMKDGQDQIMAGFLGLIILLSSYLILNTINPQLVIPEGSSVEALQKGIYLCVSSGCVDNPEDSFDTPIPITQGGKYFDLKNILPKREDGSSQTLQSIKFRSSPEDLTVKVYSDSSCSDLIYTGNEGSGETMDITGNSIEMVYHWPGVYLYAGKNCDETSEYKIYQTSSSTLPDFDNKAQSIKFVYGFSDIGAIQVLKEEAPTEAEAKNIAQERCQERGGDETEYVTETEYEFQYRCKAYDKKYAAILHEEENFTGGCLLVDPTVNGECFSLSGSSAKEPSPLNGFSFGESNAFAAGVCDTTIDGHDGDWWCTSKHLTTGMCDGEVKFCLDDDTIVRFGCKLGAPMMGLSCFCDDDDSCTEDCNMGEKCIDGEDWDAQCVESEGEDGEESPPTELTPPFTGVSSITLYLKPLEETTPGGVTFFGDENYTANKDPYVLGPYKDTEEPNLGDANNKITSMKIEGHYVALLFDGVNYTGECEVFMSSEQNLRNHRIGQCGWWGRGDCLESFIIRAKK